MKSQTSAKLYHACPSTKRTFKDHLKSAACVAFEFFIFILMASFILMLLNFFMKRANSNSFHVLQTVVTSMGIAA